jgi:hypothetical protein
MQVLQGDVVIDDGYLGGEHIGKAGRGSENKVSFVAAVELSEEGHPLVARFDQAGGLSKLEIGRRAKYYLSEVVGKGRCSIDMPVLLLYYN